MDATFHLALGLQGQGREDAILHLLNFVWPNIFENAPHLVQRCFDCIDAMRVTVGPTKVLQYLLQGLFHPARRVREVYWRLYNQLYIGAQESLVKQNPKSIGRDHLRKIMPYFWRFFRFWCPPTRRCNSRSTDDTNWSLCCSRVWTGKHPTELLCHCIMKGSLFYYLDYHIYAKSLHATRSSFISGSGSMKCRRLCQLGVVCP